MTNSDKYAKPSDWLATLDSHGIYNVHALEECEFPTDAIPTHTEDETAAAIEARGLGGELHREGVLCFYGWQAAEALCASLTGKNPAAMFHGRGKGFRACIAALREEGK